MRSPLTVMETIILGNARFSHLRSSFFLPKSYMRREAPCVRLIPTKTRPWKYCNARGMPSTGVLCSSDSWLPVTLYTRICPEPSLFCRSIFVTVPTSTNVSPGREGKVHVHTHNAASSSSNGMSCTVSRSTGSTTRMHDAHLPSPARCTPYTASGIASSSSSSSWPSTSIPALTTESATSELWSVSITTKQLAFLIKAALRGV
mmetsp:Transcript_4321/g.6972  ORF Transcript_4321/g.6972 Transcript_4321/m.6972 type:complete len:203 (-) Transcript_4321:2522-3130(-)